MITASYGRYGQRAARIGPDRLYAGSDIPNPIQFSFSKEGPDHTVQNRAGFAMDGLVRVWPKHLVWKLAGVEESSGPVSGRAQPAHYRFLSFRLGSVLPQTARIIITVQNQPGSELVLADCQVFAKRIQSGASRCARIIRPASGQCFRTDPDWIRIGSGMFTGGGMLGISGWVLGGGEECECEGGMVCVCECCEG